MTPLNVEEALDFVEAEIVRFHSDHDTGDFHLLSCGPDPQHIGQGGGPMGVVMWNCEEERFDDCQKLIRTLLHAIEKIDVVVDVEVTRSLDGDGELWYIEFARE